MLSQLEDEPSQAKQLNRKLTKPSHILYPQITARKLTCSLLKTDSLGRRLPEFCLLEVLIRCEYHSFICTTTRIPKATLLILVQFSTPEEAPVI